MKKLLLGGLIAVLALLLYIMFTFIFVRFFQVVSDMPLPAPPTPAPTFTPTATITPLVISQSAPAPPTPTPLPSPTATPVLLPTSEPAPTEPPAEAPAATATPAPASPQVQAASTVNVRAGPGVNYPVVASLPPGVPLAVTGRNGDGSWWQVQHQGQTAWVAASVVESTAVEGVAVAQAPPPPAQPPTATPAPAEPTRPAYQFEPTGWYGARNLGLTRFLGTITDINGDPVNGATVEAQCGTYRVISNPSGPVPGFGRGDSMTDPPGFYDITIDRKPVPCNWVLTVVHTEDGQTVLAQLSERIEVEVTVEQSIITANWRKNW